MMDENTVAAIIVICFFGWIPILALGQVIVWIVSALN